MKLNRLHQEQVKAKIRASALIRRLQTHALAIISKNRNAGTTDHGNPIMRSSQVRAAMYLLNKVLSDAPRVLASDPENPLIPAEGFRPTELPREALLAIAAGRKAYYKDGQLVIEDAPAKTNGNGSATNGSGNGAIH